MAVRIAPRELRACIDEYEGAKNLASALNTFAQTRGSSANFTARTLNRWAKEPRKRQLNADFARILELFFGPTSKVLVGSPEYGTHHDGDSATRRPSSRYAPPADPAPVEDSVPYFYDKVRDLARAYLRVPANTLLDELRIVESALFARTMTQAGNSKRAIDAYFLRAVANGMLANACHDLGHPAEAMKKAHDAFWCAEQAGHDGLKAFSLGMQSLVAFRAPRRERIALERAQKGTSYITRSSSSIAPWLALCEARAWARVGNHLEVDDAVKRAMDSRETAKPDDLTEIGGICTSGEAEQDYYAGDAWARLPGRKAKEKAEPHCRRAVNAYLDPSSPEWDFGCMACSVGDLTIVQYHLWKFDEAAFTFQPLLALPSAQWVQGVRQTAYSVLKLLNTGPELAEFQDIREQIEIRLATAPSKQASAG